MNTKAFSLLEVVIYIAVLTILSVGVARVVAWSVGNTLPAQAKHIIAVTVVDSVFIRDIHIAPYHKKKWKQIEPNSIVWSQADRIDIGWGKEGDSLIRVVGMFDAKKQQWTKKRKSIVAQEVKKIIFDVSTIERKSIVTEVLLKIVWNNNKTKTYIAQLYNRVMPK